MPYTASSGALSRYSHPTGRRRRIMAFEVDGPMSLLAPEGRMSWHPVAHARGMADERERAVHDDREAARHRERLEPRQRAVSRRGTGP